MVSRSYLSNPDSDLDLDLDLDLDVSAVTVCDTNQLEFKLPLIQVVEKKNETLSPGVLCPKKEVTSDSRRLKSDLRKVV